MEVLERIKMNVERVKSVDGWFHLVIDENGHNDSRELNRETEDRGMESR